MEDAEEDEASVSVDAVLPASAGAGRACRREEKSVGGVSGRGTRAADTAGARTSAVKVAASDEDEEVEEGEEEEEPVAEFKMVPKAAPNVVGAGEGDVVGEGGTDR